MKTKAQISLETGFDFSEGKSITQKTTKGVYKYINGTLFECYDLGRWCIYSKVI